MPYTFFIKRAESKTIFLTFFYALTDFENSVAWKSFNPEHNADRTNLICLNNTKKNDHVSNILSFCFILTFFRLRERPG